MEISALSESDCMASKLFNMFNLMYLLYQNSLQASQLHQYMRLFPHFHHQYKPCNLHTGNFPALFQSVKYKSNPKQHSMPAILLRENYSYVQKVLCPCAWQIVNADHQELRENIVQLLSVYRLCSFDVLRAMSVFFCQDFLQTHVL